MNKDKFIIIGRSTCPFCIMAVDFLLAKDQEHVFLDYHDHLEILEEYKHFHKQQTVPIILANNKITGLVHKIGGYSDLLEYDSGG
tara:strand:- start:100 stop:354 length:255 start_codon:yes stop_codon:yes gene_type:complete